jgi:hypothetical protein
MQVLLQVCKHLEGELLIPDMLINIFSFRLKIINTPTIDAKQKHGALHMVGSPADVLLKKKYSKIK